MKKRRPASPPKYRIVMRRSVRVAAAAAAAAAATALSSTIKGAEGFLNGPACTITATTTVASNKHSPRLLSLQGHHTTHNCHQPRRTLQSSINGDTSEINSSSGGGAWASLGREKTTDNSSGPQRSRHHLRRPRGMAPLNVAAAGGEGQPVNGGASGGAEKQQAAVQPQRREGGGDGRRGFGHVTDETLDLIRASTSIIEVVGGHVEMKPAGRGMIGCCPFHQERTPSFSVDDSRGSYHCFGCGASGDVITFCMQIDGLGFREVVSDLAEKADISLGYDNASQGGRERASGDEKARREARERLSLVLQMAAQFYTRCLVEMPAAGGARAHILERGISPMTVMDFQLGYSPSDLTSPLIQYLDQEGFELDTLVDAGLVPDTSKWKYKPSPNNPRSRVDRFRGRLVVPIRDHRGSVIGFGARDLGDSQAQESVGSGFVIPDSPKKGKGGVKGTRRSASAAVDKESKEASSSSSSSKIEALPLGGAVGDKKARPPAKYLNSPETTLFKKGKNVFGLDLAKETIRTDDMALVVEGYFDVIKLHDAGIRCAVGVLGTAISIDQLQLCARYSRSKRVVLCMDGDAAGQRAIERLCESPASSGLDSLSESGVSVSVACIPEDSGCKDPADFLQAHGAEEFRRQVMQRAVPWSDWQGDRILAEHDFAGDANDFRRCTDRLTSFIADLSIPADQTFLVHRFAKALAGGSEVMRHQLEFDLASMSNEKRTRKNALRRRVTSSPTAATAPSSQTPATTVETPSIAETFSSSSPAAGPNSSPSAELRRLASGHTSDNWDVSANVSMDKPKRRKAGSGSGSRQDAESKGAIVGGTSVGGDRGEAGGEGGAGVEGSSVVRDHGWVMERVKIRKREESRVKRERFAKKDSAIWSPSMEQEVVSQGNEDGDDNSGRRSSGSNSTTEVALRDRIVDQAQRFLLTLAVHDPSRRARCAEEVSRHGLSVGNERRRWLFDAVTLPATAAAAATAATTTVTRLSTPEQSSLGRGSSSNGSSSGFDEEVDASQNNNGFPFDAEADLPWEEAEPGRWSGPSAEALEVGGDVLFAEIRAAAPGGYFGLRGKAGRRASSAAGEGEGGEEPEETLDWVFDRKEANRVAAGKNADLVLLEVVMTMLKEKAAAKMHSLSLELAETSDAIPRTMAEVAAAGLLDDPLETTAPSSLLSEEEPLASGDEPSGVAAAAAAAVGVGGVDVSEKEEGGTSGGRVRRDRADAQVEVDRLKARQLELFGLIQATREEVEELDAQRKAFTRRLPKVKAEGEASRKEQARKLAAAKAAGSARAAPSSVQSSSSIATCDSEADSAIDGVTDSVTDGKEGEGPSKPSIDHLPMIFLEEGTEPEEGINIYDVEGNLAAARAASAAGGDQPPQRPPPQQQQQQQQHRGDHGRENKQSATARHNTENVSGSAAHVAAVVDWPAPASRRPPPPQPNNNAQREARPSDDAAACLPPTTPTSGAAGPVRLDHRHRHREGGGEEAVGRPGGAGTVQPESDTAVISSSPGAAEGREQRPESIGARRFRVSAAATVANKWNGARGAGEMPPAISSIAVPPTLLDGRGEMGDVDGETAAAMAREAEERTDLRQEDDEEVFDGVGFYTGW